MGSTHDHDKNGSMGAIAHDSTGINISYKNFAYCELTALYWIWKNTKHEITGLVHYRRFLAAHGSDRPLSQAEIEEALDDCDILTSDPVHLNCSVKEQYCFCHVASDLLALYDVMNKQPELYREAFHRVMDSNTIVPFNMMIAKREVLNAYCKWLFPVLAACEREIDLYAGRDAYQQRAFGFLAERLFLVWLYANGVNFKPFATLGEKGADDLRSASMGNYALDLWTGLNGLKEGMLFDSDFYIAMNEDVRKAYPKSKALKHFLENGMNEGRMPSPYYSMKSYIAQRPELRSVISNIPERYLDELEREVRDGGVVALVKNITLGITQHEEVDYSPVYDWLYYTQHYDDVPNDFYRTDLALEHFLTVGIPEGRQASRGFSLDKFKEKHRGLSLLLGNRNVLYYLLYIKVYHRIVRGIDWKYAD